MNQEEQKLKEELDYWVKKILLQNNSILNQTAELIKKQNILDAHQEINLIDINQLNKDLDALSYRIDKLESYLAKTHPHLLKLIKI